MPLYGATLRIRPSWSGKKYNEKESFHLSHVIIHAERKERLLKVGVLFCFGPRYKCVGNKLKAQPNASFAPTNYVHTSKNTL